MTPAETVLLLAYAGNIDSRVRRKADADTEMQARAWHAILGDVAPADAEAAITAHYRRPDPQPILPGDIRGYCVARANERVERHTPAAIGAGPLNPRPQFDLAAAAAAIAARWSAPLTTNSPPRRSERTPRQPVKHAETDADRVRNRRAVTVCFRCVADVPVPAGWRADDRQAPPVYCEPCQAALERREEAVS